MYLSLYDISHSRITGTHTNIRIRACTRYCILTKWQCVPADTLPATFVVLVIAHLPGHWGAKIAGNWWERRREGGIHWAVIWWHTIGTSFVTGNWQPNNGITWRNQAENTNKKQRETWLRVLRRVRDDHPVECAPNGFHRIPLSDFRCQKAINGNRDCHKIMLSIIFNRVIPKWSCSYCRWASKKKNKEKKRKMFSYLIIKGTQPPKAD